MPYKSFFSKILLITITLTMQSMALFASHPESLEKEKNLKVLEKAETIINNTGDYLSALGPLLKFVSEAEKYPDDATYKESLMRAYNELSVIFYTYNDYGKALSYSEKSMELSVALGNAEYQEDAAYNLAQCYLKLKKYQKANDAADKMLSIKGDTNNSKLFSYYLVKGEICQAEDRFEESIRYWKQADASINDSKPDLTKRAILLYYIGDTYIKMNVPDSAGKYLNEAWQLTDTTHDFSLQRTLAYVSFRLNVIKKNPAEALRYMDIFIAISDSISRYDKFMDINNDHQALLMHQKGEEIDSLANETARQRTVILVIVLLLLLSVTFLVILIRKNKALNAAYHTIYEKNKKLYSLSEPEAPACVPGKEEAPDDAPEEEPEEKTAETAGTENRELYDRILAVMSDPAIYCDSNFTLTTLTQLVKSNITYVSKTIKAFSGQNVPSFISEYRIREACRRLLDVDTYGNLTIQAIGESVGFNSQVSFNRTFKKITGITPSMYHKMSKEDQKHKQIPK